MFVIIGSMVHGMWKLDDTLNYVNFVIMRSMAHAMWLPGDTSLQFSKIVFKLVGLTSTCTCNDNRTSLSHDTKYLY